MGVSTQPRPGAPHAHFIDARRLGADDSSTLMGPSAKIEFAEVTKDHGFGDVGYAQWQFVPKGEYRNVLLLNGNHLNLEVSNDSIVGITERVGSNNSEKRIGIEGLKAGKAWLIAVDPKSGSALARLEIVVGKQLRLKLGVYRLFHKSGQPNTTCSSVKTSLIPTVNSVYQPQSNIVVKAENTSCKPLNTSRDFGQPIMLTELLEYLRAKNWPSSEHISVILVGAMQESHTGRDDLYGYYDPVSQCVIVEDLFPLSKMGLVLAHEIGHHFFGSTHTKDPDNLMRKGTKGHHSIHLNPEQIKTARSLL